MGLIFVHEDIALSQTRPLKNFNFKLESTGGYSYKGLLYDAKKGVTVSQILIYQAFVSILERGETPPMDMLNFIGKEISLVLREKQTPKEMFKKSKAKLPTSSPHYWQLVDLTRKAIDFTGDMHAAFEHVSDILGGTPSPSQVKNHYYFEEARLKRIRQVTELLNEYDEILKTPRVERPKGRNDRLEEIDTELKEIYCDIDKLA